MKEAAVLTGGLLFLIASLFFRVAWSIFKIAAFLAIMWGAIKGLSDTSLPVIGAIVSWAKIVSPSFFGASFLFWVSENWIGLAVLLIFLNSISANQTLDKLSETGGYTRIFIGTLLSYLGIQTEVPSQQKIREKGMWATIKERFYEGIAHGIFGMEQTDERLNAKAVRDGEEVHLENDIKKVMNRKDEIKIENR